MQPIQVLAQLLDLPSTFTRPGEVFRWLYNSLAAGESQYTLASDGIAAELYQPSALGPWLSTWGEILGIPRLPGESDLAFSNRIQNTLEVAVGTLAAVQAWTSYFLDTPLVSVTEAAPGQVGYTISIPAGYPAQTIANWITTLDRVRPAGVPFNLAEIAGPLMLGTYSYIGGSGFAGSYLGNGAVTVPLSIPASTTNARPLVGTTLLTDPNLNGQLSLGLTA